MWIVRTIDCGGPFCSTDILKVISDKNDEGYEDMMEWLGDDFEPGFFDIKEINEMLKDEDYGYQILMNSAFHEFLKNHAV